MNKKQRTAEDYLKNRIEMIKMDMASAERTLKAFIADFRKDAAHAFEWANSEFRAAATVRVGTIMLNMVEAGREQKKTDEQILENLQRVALENALRVAAYPPSSTSPTSNLMEQAIGSVWADIAEKNRFALLALSESKKS